MQTHRPSGRRAAFVTGASYGIGAAIALELARDGFDLAVSATQLKNLNDIVGKLEAAGARVIPLALNLQSLVSLEHAIDATIRGFGQLDVLVNNAGVSLHKRVIDVTPEDWNTVIQTNVAGTFFACQKIGRHLIATGRPGCIVNLASTFGVIGYAGVSVYGISKAAIIHMSKMLAVEWAEYNIRVNTVAPGTVETPSRLATLSDPELRRTALERLPLHRFGLPEEIGAAVRYLVSPAAAYITGQTLLLDGGLTACGARGVGSLPRHIEPTPLGAAPTSPSALSRS
jgi:NAD(P)-dependent dehydrogenase (short-subunit alcohol dehydrogenase family)